MNEHRIEYNHRSFDKDLEDFSVWVLEQRMKGRKSMDEDGHRVPFFPDTGHLHKRIDQEEGCPKLRVHEAHLRVARRNVWVLALLQALRKRFPAETA